MLTKIAREASAVGAYWKYEEMWHFDDKEKESGDRKNISLKEIYIPKQLLARERTFMCL